MDDYLTLPAAASEMGISVDELERRALLGDVRVLRLMSGEKRVSRDEVDRCIQVWTTDANGRRTIMEG